MKIPAKKHQLNDCKHFHQKFPNHFIENENGYFR